MYSNWGLYPSNLLFPGILAGWLSVLLIPIAIWSVFWMGWGLWRAAKENSKVWFIILLLVHTVGILDIIYIFLISKKSGRKGRK